MYTSSRKFLYVLLCTAWCYSQDPYALYGFVSCDNAFDTRQVVTSREGHGVLWPKRKDCDPSGNDINDTGQLSMIPLYARGTLRVEGPNISDDMHNHALCEADFRGTTTENASLLRLRLAYSDFDWGHTAVRIGKAWHPLYPEDCAPNLVTYDNGEPPDPRIRTPQVRVTHRFAPTAEESCHELIAMAGSFNVGSRMLGPAEDGSGDFIKSSDFIRRTATPNIHLQYRILCGDHVWGAGIDYIRTMPRLETELGYQDHETLDSASVIAYAALRFPRWRVHNKVLFTQNATAYDQPHGFAVATRDPNTDRRTYANMRAFAYWIDTEFMTDSCIRPGAFAAVYSSLGANQPLFRDADNHLILIAEEPDLDLLMKTAVRTRWIQDPIEVGAEVEVSHAQFAEPKHPESGVRKFDDFAQALQTNDVTNARFIVNLYYYF